MDRQKATKPKDPQSTALSSVLAEFDIQTQVNRMVVRAFDSLMRSNKQAFQYIKQNQNKFINFQQRLSKAETYYRNIQLNINSKIQLIENMDRRLREFAAEFWNSSKQNNNQIIAMNKKCEQLALVSRNLQNRLKQCQRNLKRLQTQSCNTNSKVNCQTTRTQQMIRQSSNKMEQKLAQQRKQIRQLADSIIQSRSLLDSKSQVLPQLLKDLQVYKNDRPQITRQMQKIFEELEHRSFKVDLVQIRGYLDSKIVSANQKYNNMFLRLDTQIKVQERDRKREHQKASHFINQANASMHLLRQQIQCQINSQTIQLSKQTQSLSEKKDLIIQDVAFRLTQIKVKYQEQIPKLIKKAKQNQKSLEDAYSKLSSSEYKIKQIISNVESSNKMIDSIVKQNGQRCDQMNNLMAGSQDQGKVSQQLTSLFEKVDILSNQISKIQQQEIIQINSRVQKNHTQCTQSVKQLNSSFLNLNNKMQTSSSHTKKQIVSVQGILKKLINQSKLTIQSKITLMDEQVKKEIADKIVSIKDQLHQLDRIHVEIKQFKEVIRKQIEENDKVNVSVAEKMQRIMALFTKLKSDNSVKLEQLTADLQRRAVQLKSNLSDLHQIKKYLSLSNQCVNLLLSVNAFRDSQREYPHQANNNIHLPIDQKQGMSGQQSFKPIKISSILEGWILECDQNHQKIRYRGQNFNFSNRTKLTQMFLQYSVKNTQKLKGTILQNGRDTFMKILESNEDAFQHRKRATSKRRPSQLPKLYI